MRLASLALVLVLLLSACGASDEGGGEGETGGGASPATELRITLWPGGKSAGEMLEATLTCDPAGGTHPDPAAACAALEANAGSLEPVPPDAICTQIYGGPEEAEVEGVFRGEEIHARFGRQNGCEISRWDALGPLFALARP